MISELENYQRIRTSILDLFPELISLAQSAGMTRQSQLLSECQNKVLLNRFVVMVVGDFGRGKSTLINALLGESVLPTRLTPCTASITIIQHGDEPKVIKTFWGIDKLPEEISFDAFQHEAVLAKNYINTDDSEDVSTFGAGIIPELGRTPIKKLDLYYPTNLCQNGVQLVDSPGLNEHHRQTEITLEFLPLADAVIMVMAATRLLAENEVRFIRQLVKQGFKHIFFVINFRDEIDDEDTLQEIKNEATNKLREILPEDVPLILKIISSEQALDGRLTSDINKIDESHIVDLESELGHFLTHRRGKVFLTSVITLMRSSCNEIELAIRRQQELAVESIEDLGNRQKAIENRINGLKDRKESIKNIVEKQCKNTRSKLLDGLRNKMRDIVRYELPEVATNWKYDKRIMILESDYKACTEYFVNEADRFVKNKMTEWVQKDVTHFIETEIEFLCSAIGEDIQKVMTILDEIRFEIKADAMFKDIEGKKPAHIVERLLTAGTAALLLNPVIAAMGGAFGVRVAAEQFGLQVGAALLMITLGVLNIPAFLIAGGIVGALHAFFKMKATKEAIREKIIAEIQKFDRPSSDLENRFGDSISNIFEIFYKAITETIDSILNDVRGQLEEIIKQKVEQDQEGSNKADEIRRRIKKALVLAEKIEAFQTEMDQM